MCMGDKKIHGERRGMGEEEGGREVERMSGGVGRGRD